MVHQLFDQLNPGRRVDPLVLNKVISHLRVIFIQVNRFVAVSTSKVQKVLDCSHLGVIQHLLPHIEQLVKLGSLPPSRLATLIILYMLKNNLLQLFKHKMLFEPLLVVPGHPHLLGLPVKLIDDE